MCTRVKGKEKQDEKDVPENYFCLNLTKNNVIIS
jgi:hypothetical protein